MPEENKQKLSVSGSVDTVIFQSDESGYTVLMLESEGECITVVGTMPGVSENEMITAWGEFTNHPVYGVQFKADYFERVMPGTKTENFKVSVLRYNKRYRSENRRAYRWSVRRGYV